MTSKKIDPDATVELSPLVLELLRHCAELDADRFENVAPEKLKAFLFSDLIARAS